MSYLLNSSSFNKYNLLFFFVLICEPFYLLGLPFKKIIESRSSLSVPLQPPFNDSILKTLNNNNLQRSMIEVFKSDTSKIENKDDVLNMKKLQAHELVEKLNTLTPLNMKDIQPPDHLDGAPIENDGHLNHEFRKEIILGHHMEFEKKKDFNAEETLKKIFKLADINGDKLLEIEELNNWMVSMVEGHLKDTREENDQVFTHLDINKNGLISWDEFSIHFLLAKGYSLEKAVEISKADVYNEAAILPEEKERLIRYKFRWVEADEVGKGGKGDEEGDVEGDVDGGSLDREELMNFRHPEQSPVMIKKVAMDLLEKFDNDEDGIITEDEFSEPPKFFHEQYDTDSEKLMGERRTEFRNFIDLNKDGRVDIEELKVYVDPRNKNRMRVETENLIMLADENGDKRLSLSEVLENSELILGSKMVDASSNFHDEF